MNVARICYGMAFVFLASIVALVMIAAGAAYGGAGLLICSVILVICLMPPRGARLADQKQEQRGREQLEREQRAWEQEQQQRNQREARAQQERERARWLKDAGLNDRAALQRLEALAGGEPDTSLALELTLSSVVARRLSLQDPRYLALDRQMFVRQLEIAEEWARGEIRWAKLEPAYPPTEWLIKRISVDDIDLRDMRSRPRGEWMRLMVRKS